MLLNANYLLPLDPKKRWNLDVNAASAFVDYLPGESQPGNWLNGVGGGILYHSPSNRWKIMLNYGYGIDAIRSHGRGANSIGVLMQLDLGRKHSQKFNSAAAIALARLAVNLRLKDRRRHFKIQNLLARHRVACFIMQPGAHMVELADTLL